MNVSWYATALDQTYTIGV